MNKLVTIIIPVYNAELYLKECLISVIEQSYTNLEILLIDDGSTDSSGTICDEYAAIDARIKVIHKLNGGVSSARNSGIEMASGDYIYFADADDLLFTETISKLCSLISTSDIAMCMMRKFDDIADIQPFYTENCAIMEIDEILQDVLIRKNSAGYLFNKLFKASIIKQKKIRFNTKIHNCEDELFVLDYLDVDSKALFCNSIVYAYRNTPGSALNSGINQKSATAVYSREMIYNRVKELTTNQQILSTEYEKFICTLIHVYHSTMTGTLNKNWKNEIRIIERKYRGEYRLNSMPLKKMVGYTLLKLGMRGFCVLDDVVSPKVILLKHSICF